MAVGEKRGGRSCRIALAVMVVVVFAVGVWACIRIVSHERAQQDAIRSLQGRVAYLEGREGEVAPSDFASKSLGGGFDWLALGNSITWHPVVDYWWGEWGMAASSRGLDWFHLVIAELEAEHGEVNAQACNYSIWEMQGYDRAETYGLIDGYLVQGVDLVTVQLGENVADTSTFESDLRGLVQHIQEKCPEAQVVIIDEFWDNGHSEIKRSVCKELGVAFADLSQIRGDPSYQAGVGTLVSGDDGKEHVIQHDGVARHPGDSGMAYIARVVLEAAGLGT